MLKSCLVQVLIALTQAEQNTPSFVLNTLSVALAYLTIHTHQLWPTMIEDLVQCLSRNVDQGLCLLKTIQYMANDCDNQSIVIEDSIRQAYYRFLD